MFVFVIGVMFSFVLKCVEVFTRSLITTIFIQINLVKFSIIKILL